MSYAAAIKRLREKMLLTQKEFAEYLGVKFVTVNRWENGSFEPTMKTKRSPNKGSFFLVWSKC